MSELHILRVVLGLAGLLKKRRGHFSITERGRRLLASRRAAELFELLLRTYFGRFNIFYWRGYPEDPELQRHIVLALWTIRRLAVRPVRTSRIARLLPRNEAVWSPRLSSAVLYPGEFDDATAALILEPLRGLGLLRGGERSAMGLVASDWRERADWEVTPLFDEAISFALGGRGEELGEGDAGAGASGAARPRRPRLYVVSDVAAAPPSTPDTSEEGSSVQATADIACSTITLQDVEPPVWRRLEVPMDTTFERLHVYLNAAMGWLDYHLHEFEVAGRRIAADDADDETQPPYEDETAVTLAEVLAQGTRDFLYRYDFGDGWEHLVEVESVEPAEPAVFYPRCVGAGRACPPEDCGGAPGFTDLLRALADPTDPERDELLEWLGESFDPEAVDVEAVNRLLHLAATGEVRPDDLDHFS